MDEAPRRVLARLRARHQQVAARTASQRREMLRAFRAALQRRRATLTDAVAQDLGRPPVETEILEIQPLIVELDHAIRHLPDWMAERRVRTPWVLAGTRASIRHEPRGVVLILAPWNYPVNLTLAPLVAAVAAGNSAVTKPSEKAPATAEALATLLAEAFEPDHVACVPGDVETAEALLALPFDHILFTGSTRTGRIVARAAADHLAGVTLELGGKSPAIVHHDADLDVAAERIVWGKFINAGQTCIAPDYVLVHRQCAGPFVTRLATTLARRYAPRGEEPAAHVCRIIDAAGWSRLTGQLEDAIHRGARVVTGGRIWPDTRHIEPTILTGVPGDSPLLREEIFGPLLPVVPVESLEAALAHVRSLPPPLALYVFSRSESTFEQAMRGASSGAAIWNQVALHFGNPHLPFGGGHGTYHGWFGFRAFSHERAVLRQGRFSLTHLFYPPYGPHTARRLRWLRRFMGS